MMPAGTGKEQIRNLVGLPISFKIRPLSGDNGPSVASDTLIEIKDVNFAYGRRPILTGINMTVPRGKVVALMGISGSGKTTLLRLIGGARKPPPQGGWAQGEGDR